MIGRIYAIKSEHTDKVYIGSTTGTLKDRLINHRSDYNRYLKGSRKYMTSFELLKYDDCYIELLEEIDVENVKELHKFEGKYIKEIECVNKRIPGRTIKEYYEEHKEKLIKKMKKYQKEHRDEILDYKKLYYEEHRDELLEKQKQKMTCECGAIVTKNNIATHRKSQKHIKYISNLDI